MDYLYFVFATLIFVAVVLLIEGVYLAWNSSKGPEAQRLMRRVQAMSTGSVEKTTVSITKKRVESASPFLQRGSRFPFRCSWPALPSRCRFLSR